MLAAETTSSLTDSGSIVRYLARQPILDSHEVVHGYELLFRGGPETLFSAINSDRASLCTMDYSLAHGPTTLTNGKRAFINCTRELLVGGLVTLLPSDSTVLEILEDIEPDPEVLAACDRLRKLGYVLALDDFIGNVSDSAFFDFVTYVKVDLRIVDPDELRRIARRLSRRGLLLVAEKVETREEFEMCRDAGYDFFQGYFFCKPVIVHTRDISPVQQNQIQLLRLAAEPAFDLKALEQAIRPDVSLCYRLLRYLNSAAFGLYPVRSIMHALTLLGEREIRKWIALVSAALLANGKTPELARVAMVRGRFCELLAPRGRSEDYFLVGLFSLLDTMFQRPMSQIMPQLPVADDCRAALLGGRNHAGQVLALCEQCEKADFSEPGGDLRISVDELWHAYGSASLWVDSLLGHTP